MFLDRDGTVTQPRHYPSRPDDLVLQADIGPALHSLQKAGFVLVLVTNQSGVARGFFTEHTVHTMHERLGAMLADHNVRLNGIYFCPHHVEGSVAQFRRLCQCRKPAPGMLYQAAQDLRLDLARSWMVGDSPCDIAAGHSAGTRTALVGTSSDSLPPPDICSASVAKTLLAVLRTSGREGSPPGGDDGGQGVVDEDSGGGIGGCWSRA
ncbi:D-glycero-alpha-D-manno-heptose-1,7-bisphosphate 7-phosphatase [Kitasatospora sp. NPDC051984]|uniref:D-glycero-alpha-D-manno-heptose-1,7-bisphosphate 7-phosphatase n=1 Tax=Kitasatospora sp. NPDC051984 TaxID=3364059 RepID=UPI0037C77097